MADLVIRDLRVAVEGKEILKGVNLEVNRGEFHAVMGPNGSGKSTLAMTLMGHPKYEVVGGEVLFKGENILEMSPDERAKLGLFLAFQYPMEIEGVGLSQFLWSAIKARSDNPDALKGKALMDFRKELERALGVVKLPPEFADRYLNVNFSGGEKKRTEIAQLLTLKPEIAILDETDSGLDIDSVRIVAEAVKSLKGPDFGALIITHYQRILNYLEPDYVHVMVDGRIVKSGGPELAHTLEEKGYDWILQEVGVA